MSQTENYYLAKPATLPAPAVLVLPAWWGLNQFFKDMCDRLAGEGFVALGLDLFHGHTASTIEEAEKLRGTLKPDVAASEIMQAASRLRAIAGADKIGVIGFSLGGAYALWLAEQPSIPVTATAIFYCTRAGKYTSTGSALQFHFAEKDDYESPADVKATQDALKAAGREAEFFTYPGTGHWFFEQDRPDAYKAEAAGLAWSRTVDFLRKRI